MTFKLKASEVVTGLQFVWIGVFVSLGSTWPKSLVILIPWSFGLLVGGWAVVLMRRQLKITPEPHARGQLISSGPYRWLRHPMYFALLLFLTPALIQDYSPLRLVIFGLLMLTLIVKTNLEEKFLMEKFPDYEVYKKRTWRFLPFVF